MEQTLYLVRHAHATAFQPDSERPLSVKGKKQIERISSALREKGLIEPSAIWHSPYLRAIETATLLHEGLGLSVGLETVDGINPFGDQSTPWQIAWHISHKHFK